MESNYFKFSVFSLYMKPGNVTVHSNKQTFKKFVLFAIFRYWENEIKRVFFYPEGLLNQKHTQQKSILHKLH